MIRRLARITLLCCPILVWANAHDWGYLPAPLIPADNPLNAAKADLGKRLFSDERLSVTKRFSCASCHQPQRHFTDGRRRAMGATGQIHPRNTPTLYNAAFNVSYGWLDEGITTLEQQHRIPLLNTAPVEMGFSAGLLDALKSDPDYPRQFKAAFGAAQINTDTVIKALASYVRTLIPPATAFDAYVFEDDADALSSDAKAGMRLFFSARLGCSLCHASLNLSGPIQHARTQAEPVFHVMGVGGSQLAVRAPSLRAVAFTAPYMHDGSLTDLNQVLEHYQNTPSERVPKFSLNATEQRQLIDFLRTL